MLMCKRVERQVVKYKFVLSIKSWILTFFSKMNLYMILYDAVFNVATYILH
jgi:hypothetical protein